MLGFGFRSRGVAALRDRWRDRSLGSGWPADDDEWPCPEVDALCEGLVRGAFADVDVRLACELLGRQRAGVGTYLEEARADAAIGLQLAGLSQLRRLRLLEALTDGWTDYAVDRLAVQPFLDDTHELPTMAYLATRLAEVYREAALRTSDVARQHLLVVAETRPSRDRLIVEARTTALYSALRFAFVGGESISVASNRRVVVLAGREQPRLSDSLARLRSELTIAVHELRLPGARTWCRALPSDPNQLSSALRGVVQ